MKKIKIEKRDFCLDGKTKMDWRLYIDGEEYFFGKEASHILTHTTDEREDGGGIFTLPQLAYQKDATYLNYGKHKKLFPLVILGDRISAADVMAEIKTISGIISKWIDSCKKGNN